MYLYLFMYLQINERRKHIAASHGSNIKLIAELFKVSKRRVSRFFFDFCIGWPYYFFSFGEIWFFDARCDISRGDCWKRVL